MSYTPPDIRNIYFILGDEGVTSPFVTIVLPAKQLVSESINSTVTFVDVHLPAKSILSVIENPIPVYIEVVLPAIVMSSISHIWTITESSITLPKVNLDSMCANQVVTWVYLEKSKLRLHCEMGSDTILSFPKMVLSSLCENKIVIYASMVLPKKSVNLAVENWKTITAHLSLPARKSLCDFLTENTVYLDMKLPTRILESVIYSEDAANCALAIPYKKLRSESTSWADYTVIKYHRPGDGL